MSDAQGHDTPAELGKYRFIGKIADGGIGTVWKAVHPDTNELVAIKFMKVLTAEGRARRRFEQEISVSLDLDHPNLVRGLDYGLCDGYPFLVMEFVDGCSLRDRIEKDGRLPAEEAVDLIVQIADALHYMHGRGVIHRDVKPDNILLGADGQAKLTDLGLVKNTEYNLDLTRSATGLGTPNFMAPEQFSDAKGASVLYDVYSLGATLYMAVTGTLPFNAKTDLAMIKKKITNDIVPPRKLIWELREEVDLAIRRAIRGDPSQRFPDVSEFVQALIDRPLPIWTGYEQATEEQTPADESQYAEGQEAEYDQEQQYEQYDQEQHHDEHGRPHGQYEPDEYDDLERPHE